MHGQINKNEVDKNKYKIKGIQNYRNLENCKSLGITGIGKAFSEAGVFGPDVVENKVMNGGNYIQSKDSMTRFNLNL